MSSSHGCCSCHHHRLILFLLVFLEFFFTMVKSPLITSDGRWCRCCATHPRLFGSSYDWLLIELRSLLTNRPTNKSWRGWIAPTDDGGQSTRTQCEYEAKWINNQYLRSASRHTEYCFMMIEMMTMIHASAYSKRKARLIVRQSYK